MTLRPALLAVPLFAGLFAGSALAQDTPCTADSDCAEGQICALTDCARPCDTDVDPACEPTDCGGGGTCIDVSPPVEQCASDADCAAGERCVTETIESCTGCACADGDPACDCDVPDGGACTTETFSVCLPPYASACAVDGDCGAGFTCEFLESCACSGGGGSDGEAPPDADPAPPAPEEPAEPCVCEPATEGSCVLERVECTSAADCLEGFECVEEGSAGVCSVSDDGSVDCEAPTERVSICVPPGFASGEEAQAGLVRADDSAAEDDEEDEAAPRTIFDCSTASPAGALPLAALALLLRRRRR